MIDYPAIGRGRERVATKAVTFYADHHYRQVTQAILTHDDFNDQTKAKLIPSSFVSRPEDYRAAIVGQNVFLSDTQILKITNIDAAALETAWEKIQQLEGIISVHRTAVSETYGKWNVVTLKDIGRTQLLEFDKILNASTTTSTKTFYGPPRRLQSTVDQIIPAKYITYVQTETQKYKDLNIMSQPPTNAWNQRPKFKNDTQSVVSAQSHTVSSKADEIADSILRQCTEFIRKQMQELETKLHDQITTSLEKTRPDQSHDTDEWKQQTQDFLLKEVETKINTNISSQTDDLGAAITILEHDMKNMQQEVKKLQTDTATLTTQQSSILTRMESQHSEILGYLTQLTSTPASSQPTYHEGQINSPDMGEFNIGYIR